MLKLVITAVRRVGPLQLSNLDFCNYLQLSVFVQSGNVDTIVLIKAINNYKKIRYFCLWFADFVCD